VLDGSTLLSRSGACAIGALARSIELTATVAFAVPLPIRSVRASQLDGGPVIFVANHRSLLDTPFLRWSMPRAVRRRLVTVGGYDFFEPCQRAPRRWFEAAWLRFIVHGYRVWMIDRRVDGAAHIAPLAALVERGWSLLLYPEGRRSRTGRLGPMQPGAALLSMRTGAPIVPMFISGSERVLAPGRWWPQNGSIRIRVGDALRAAPAEHADAFMRRVQSAIARLSDEVDPAAPLSFVAKRERAA